MMQASFQEPENEEDIGLLIQYGNQIKSDSVE